MATAASTLISRCRRFMGDYGTTDTLSISLSSSATSMTVADSTLYSPRWNVQIDNELMYVKSLPSSTVVGLGRGHMGTTAATHVVSSTITIQPGFADVEYLDALNAGIEASFPFLYQRVQDESLTSASQDWEYTIPSLNDAPIPYISKVWVKETGDTVDGFGPFPSLTSSASTLSAQWPANAEDFLVSYACQRLLASGEARRVRVDTGAIDQREQANRTGSSMSAANALYSRANAILSRCAMPPMPKHVRPTF
jgi:hypothetical protein